MGEYFKLIKVNSKCREVTKSPWVLRCIKFEELPLIEDRSPPVKDFLAALLRCENPDVLYLQGVELAFGLETDYSTGERMILRSNQLHCHCAIYMECMLNILKDEVDCEVWEKLDALKKRLSPYDMQWERMGAIEVFREAWGDSAPI